MGQRDWRRVVAGAIFGILVLATRVAAQDNPLVGVWRIQSGAAMSELVIQPDGQFSKLDRNYAAQTLITGVISVLAEPPTLRLNIQDYEPKQTCGPLGCTPIQMIAAETYRFQVEPDALILSDERGQYAFQRVQ